MDTTGARAVLRAAHALCGVPHSDFGEDFAGCFSARSNAIGDADATITVAGERQAGKLLANRLYTLHSFEVANPRHAHEWRVWEQTPLPDGAVLIPGFIGHATSYVEHPQLVADSIVAYARLVGRENVIAGADCGYSSRATFSPEVHPSIVWEKFRALAHGAQLATKELWA